MKKFIWLEEYGQLYIDKVIFESYFPVIFTCLNDRKEVFICVCCQNNEEGCKWLIGKTDGKSIVKMLRDEITVRQLLVEYSTGRITVDYKENEYCISYSNSDWDKDSIYLPKSDSYMYAEDGEFDEEINYFLTTDHIHYAAEYYEKIAEKVGAVCKNIEPIVETLNTFSAAIGHVAVPCEIVIKTIEVCGMVYSKLTLDSEEYTNHEIYRPVFTGTIQTSEKSMNYEIGTDHYADAA
ncbi:MAG: hypothetical protein LUE29_12825 [Lachnospiraceae bacterium]|nr:hypothetical protein [Lachnospiraceae bacterium]